MLLSDLLREDARLVDLLDWRLTFEPPVSHREAFDELQEIVRTSKLQARGLRRIYTGAMFGSLSSSKPVDIEEQLDLGEYYPIFDQNGRATEDMYPVESGPAPSLLVRDVSVEVTGLRESWRLLINRTANAASSAAKQTKEDVRPKKRHADTSPLCGNLSPQRTPSTWRELMTLLSSMNSEISTRRMEGACPPHVT